MSLTFDFEGQRPVFEYVGIHFKSTSCAQYFTRFIKSNYFDLFVYC